jgi:putative zinc finger protein
VHPFGDLSAYLDGALSSEARARVKAHLDTCALCRTRLAELRGTARLIAALPMPVPSRSLVPRVSVPLWLAPLRTFSTFASGAAIFVFLALGVISVFPRAQSAGTAAAPAAAQPGASGRGGAAASPQSSQDLGVSFQSTAPALTDDRSAARPSATPDAAKEIGRLDQSSTSSNNVTADQSTRQSAAPAPSPFVILLSPWLWLAAAIGFGALSFLVGRRLRSA